MGIADEFARRARGRLVAFDPGLHCGAVLFDVRRLLIVCHDFPVTQTENTLNGFHPVEQVISERWALYANKASKLMYSTMPGPEALGWVASWCHRNGIPEFRIPAKCRIPYLKEVPSVIPKTYHARDAFALGAYVLHKNNEYLPPWSQWHIFVFKHKEVKA